MFSGTLGAPRFLLDGTLLLPKLTTSTMYPAKDAKGPANGAIQAGRRTANWRVARSSR
jgi:hypothetical protein